MLYATNFLATHYPDYAVNQVPLFLNKQIDPWLSLMTVCRQHKWVHEPTDSAVVADWLYEKLHRKNAKPICWDWYAEFAENEH